MIYITGDTHGNWKSRLHHDVFPEGDTLSKNDYVIICGDFGLWHDTEDERFALNWLNAQPFSTLFVCGNHENYDRLYQYPVEEWHGGKIHKICDSVFHLMRGQVFDINGKKFLHSVEQALMMSQMEFWKKMIQEFMSGLGFLIKCFELIINPGGKKNFLQKKKWKKESRILSHMIKK